MFLYFATHRILRRELLCYGIKEHALHPEEELEQCKHFGVDVQTLYKGVDADPNVVEAHGGQLVFGGQFHDVDWDVVNAKPFVD